MSLAEKAKEASLRSALIRLGALPPNPQDLSLYGQRSTERRWDARPWPRIPPIFGIRSALRSHPCVALSSGGVRTVYARRGPVKLYGQATMLGKISLGGESSLSPSFFSPANGVHLREANKVVLPRSKGWGFAQN